MSTLMELIDAYVSARAEEWAAGECAGEPEERAARERANDLHAEIERRVIEARRILVDSLGDCLPVRILDGRA